MVCFHKLFFIGATLATYANAIPTMVPEETSLSSRNSNEDSLLNITEIRVADREVTDFEGVDKRNPRKGRMTVQWSRQGRLVFLLGADFPQEIIQSFYSAGAAGPAKVLLNNFMEWAEKRFDEGLLHFEELRQLRRALASGSLYGKGDKLAAGTDFGFGILLDPSTLAESFSAMGQALNILDWAEQGGANVKLIERANDFFDFSQIGAGQRGNKARSRVSTCPANMDLLKYGTKTVSTDLALNKSLRWGGKCDN
ncbi:hypothetical protein F5B20DRAFT_565760 [Whalleya microplaca]|nr:hypothetical protein F5B20DRAFT_565760 [Whalleya microplaca]